MSGPHFSRLDPKLTEGLLDDAAVFPPGNLPLAQAVPAHVAHRAAAHSGMVGPLVIAAKDLAELARVAADLSDGAFELTVTVPLPGVAEAVAAADAIGAARLAGLEVAVPDQTPAGDVVPALDAALAGRGLTVYVEVPRDERREPLLEALAGSPYLAKFRTGGVRAALYPDEAELADAVLAAVRAGVPFKATAGLHHALRNTDPATGFEQHGFLNLLAATGAAVEGASREEVLALLAERDGARLADRVRTLTPQVREAFRSFGTCSIAEPVEELADLGLLDPDTTKDVK
jgi:hypothetical protein